MTLNLSDGLIQANFPLWKRQRQRILDYLIKTVFPDYDIFELPTNVIRSYEKKNITDVRQSEQEAVLFDNFMILCKWGKNTPYIQCYQGEGNKIIWQWGNIDHNFEKNNQNICRWMTNCLQLATSFFDIQLILSRLRNDKTRGPTVAIFCSLVLRYLRKNMLNELDELQFEMEKTGAKNLLTLERICGDINSQILKPIKRISCGIEEDNIIGGELINFLFDQKKRVENYHIVNLLEDIISMAIERYYQVIIEWITECTLTFDLAHEFFIWDLRKQKAVSRMEFEFANKMNESELNEQEMMVGSKMSFDHAFVLIPQLIPEDFKSISQEIYRIGKYLYIMRQQKGDLDSCNSLDVSTFKNLSLGQFCKQINILYQERSQQILEHFKRQYDIINFAKQLPSFYIGLYSSWIYEFAELFELNDLISEEFDNLDKKMNGLVQKAFKNAEMRENPYNRYFQLKISKFTQGDENVPKAGTYPILELHIASGDSALRQAFPAKILEPYRKIFYHLFLINRAKYLLHRKYFIRNVISLEFPRQECVTLFLFIRFLNVYQEYICGIAANGYAKFSAKLDATKNLDELVKVQLDFVHKMMEHSKLDQENEEFCQWIEMLSNVFCLYATEDSNFLELNRKASPIVGKIKKHLLENRRSLNTLKNLLFGCYFSAVGATANEEPLWKLLQHIDEMPDE